MLHCAETDTSQALASLCGWVFRFCPFELDQIQKAAAKMSPHCAEFIMSQNKRTKNYFSLQKQGEQVYRQWAKDFIQGMKQTEEGCLLFIIL